MATPAYMSVTGEVQGLITAGASTVASIGGTMDLQGHEDEFMVICLDHGVVKPCDPMANRPTGRRRHLPCKITKGIDKSTPLLYAALCSGENLTSCTIRWYRDNTTGSEDNYYTIELLDAMVLDIHSHIPNTQDPLLACFGHMEEVSFTYREISWTHELASTSGADDWTANNED